jgi:hypothetical protein
VGVLGRKRFFFGKKNQKTFVTLPAESASNDKSLLLLFFRKEGLPPDNGGAIAATGSWIVPRAPPVESAMLRCS